MTGTGGTSGGTSGFTTAGTTVPGTPGNGPESDAHLVTFNIPGVEVITFEEESLPRCEAGFVTFITESMDADEMVASYILTSTDNVDRVAEKMAMDWKLNTPKMVLSVIASDKYYRNYHAEDEEDFQAGLMNAASQTEMWILVNGLHHGISASIGHCVAKELSRRRMLKIEKSMLRFLYAETPPPLTIIGVIASSVMPTAEVDALKEGTKCEAGMVTINQKHQPDSDSGAHLNPFLSHYIVHDVPDDVSSVANYFAKLETRLRAPVGKPQRFMPDVADDIITGAENSEAIADKTPLVGLLVQGGPIEIERTLNLLRQRVPVVVLMGGGLAADIIGYAMRTALETYEVENYEVYVKTELLGMLEEAFPEHFQNNSIARNQCRDRILQCVSYGLQGDSSLLTVMGKEHFKELDKTILTAVLQSHSVTQSLVHQLRWNLQLTIDWKRPDLAMTEIFSKTSRNQIRVTNDQFQQVLLRPGRDEFVELFLDHGFRLYRFLTHRRLELLFERCVDKRFFVGICLETVLGEKLDSKNHLPSSFVDGTHCTLNKLLSILTGIRGLIDPLELSLNASQDIRETPIEATQRALHALLYWAALTNKIELCHILWTRIDEPMDMALVLSSIFTRLTEKWVTDVDLKNKLRKVGQDFRMIALDLIDASNEESHSQAIRSLTVRMPRFGGHNALELALLGDNKTFIAHPCCQQHIQHMWYGNIRVRTYFNFINIPSPVKIFLCALLIFPTALWIDVVSTKYDNFVSRNVQPDLKYQKTSYRNDDQISLNPRSIIRKFCYLWRAPVTKFLMTTLSYLGFLCFLTYVVMLPFCGESLLNNRILVIWICSLFLEQLHLVVAKRMHLGSEVAIRSHLTYMAVQVLTVAIIVVSLILDYRILPFWVIKTLLSVSLIYFFYNAMGYMFPVSPVLGPILINIKHMVRSDLLSWGKLWFMTLLSGIITLQAVLFPATPFNWETLYLAFHRGIMAMFDFDLKEVQPQADTETCQTLFTKSGNATCAASERKAHYTNTTDISSCVYQSPGGFLLVMQYLFISKLIFGTLLFAICGVTLSQTEEQTLRLWKYQFYQLVTDFVLRPSLPVPLVMIEYPYFLLVCMYNIGRFCLLCCDYYGAKKKKPCLKRGFNMWKTVIKSLKKDENMKNIAKTTIRDSENRLDFLVRSQDHQLRQVDTLNHHLIAAIDGQTTTMLHLERIKNKLDEMENTSTTKDVLRPIDVHTFARRSPYPATNIQRFPVFDKFTSWDDNYPNYDPVVIVKPVSDFAPAIRPYVDPDVFRLNEPGGEDDDSEDDEAAEARPITDFKPEYNNVVEVLIDDDQAFYFDRVSWIVKDGKPMIYTIDATGVPRNPFGRTGVRGRGHLWRWGPNHMIYAIISRWRGGNLGKQYSRRLEVLVVPDADLRENVLPGNFISGSNSRYSVLCAAFMSAFLGEEEMDGATLDQEDMIQFFRQYAPSDFNLYDMLGISPGQKGDFSARQIYRGYIDDRRNTDNAWVEAEIWNFHYPVKDLFDKKIKEPEKHWRRVTSLMELDGSLVPHVMDVMTFLDSEVKSSSDLDK